MMVIDAAQSTQLNFIYKTKHYLLEVEYRISNWKDIK